MTRDFNQNKKLVISPLTKTHTVNIKNIEEAIGNTINIHENDPKNNAQ